LPRSADDALPTSEIGVALALADRLDSLAGLFAVGMEPTGTSDPYGLRRAAAGLVQILLDRGLSFSVREGLIEAARLLPVEDAAKAVDAALAFVVGRLQVMLRDEGFAHDVVEAVLIERGDDPARARESARQLAAWVEREDWQHILDSYARCVRITRDQPRLALNASQLQDPASKELYEALLAVEGKVSPESGVDDLFNLFLPLIPPIEQFFDNVLVMADDEALRNARLALLQRIARLAEGIVDLSRLEGF
jgi:glycyl-tRNA synthetase